MILFEIHQRFKSHYLNELRVSFKVNRMFKDNEKERGVFFHDFEQDFDHKAVRNLL